MAVEAVVVAVKAVIGAVEAVDVAMKAVIVAVEAVDVAIEGTCGCEVGWCCYRGLV
jgi:hypothetical protein